jgi:hypothetical protein
MDPPNFAGRLSDRIAARVRLECAHKIPGHENKQRRSVGRKGGAGARPGRDFRVHAATPDIYARHNEAVRHAESEHAREFELENENETPEYYYAADAARAAAAAREFAIRYPPFISPTESRSLNREEAHRYHRAIFGIVVGATHAPDALADLVLSYVADGDTTIPTLAFSGASQPHE